MPMYDIYLILSILFFIWIIFMGGAEKIQDTLFGFLEFGNFSDNPTYIRVVAWFGLVISIILLLV